MNAYIFVEICINKANARMTHVYGRTACSTTAAAAAAAMRVYCIYVDKWFYRKLLVCTIVLWSIICVRSRHGGTEPPCKGILVFFVFC